VRLQRSQTLWRRPCRITASATSTCRRRQKAFGVSSTKARYRKQPNRKNRRHRPARRALPARRGQGLERICVSSAILPPYARRSKSLDVLIPMLYLKGVSTGDFEESLLAMLGKGGLSASTIGRLKEVY